MYRSTEKQKKHKVTALQAVFIILSVLLMIFIFRNSAAVATESASASGSLAELLNDIFGIQISDTVLRKTAHFCEFTALGVCFVLAAGFRYKIAVIIGILYAGSDEIHQIFVPGRSCEVRDMLIDAAGVIAGAALVFLIIKIRKTVVGKRGGCKEEVHRREED